MAKSSRPSRRASASPLAVSLSVTTRMLRAHLRHVGGHEAVDRRETDSTPSLPCSALIRSTKERIGSRLVGKTSIIRQSKVDITGRISPRVARSASSTTCSARSTKSVCGNSRKQRQDVGGRDPLRRQVAVRIEFGGDQHVRPDHRADPRQQIAFAIVIALRHHGAVQAEHDAVDRQGRRELIEDLVAQRLIGLALQQPAGLGPGRGALDQRRSPPPGARRRSTTIGAEHSVGVAGCSPGPA